MSLKKRDQNRGSRRKQVKVRNVNAQAMCCTLRGISLENKVYKISSWEYCHIKASQKAEFA